jgi:two-component system chemotaxis response regulator CheY
MDTSIKILIVDDFATMRRILKNILKQLGFKNLVEADDGTTAWEVLEGQQIDLIISDWNMPKMTGLELLKKVRESDRLQNHAFFNGYCRSSKTKCYRGGSGRGFQLCC